MAVSVGPAAGSKGRTIAAGGPATPRASISSLFLASGTPLAGTDFVTLAPPPPRTVGLLYARDGHGKTTFVTDYCPEPVFLCNLDNRGEEAAYQATLQGRTVYYLPAAFPADILNMEHEDAKSYGREVLDRLVKNYNAAAEQLRGQGGTLAIDTVKELADLVKLAVRGRWDRPAGTKEDKGDFGKSDSIINRQLWHFSNKARECRVNLILISRAKEIYEGREATGRWTYDCDKVFSAACDWAMEIRKATPQDQINRHLQETGAKEISTSQMLKIKKQGPMFELEVANSKLNIGEEGKIYTEAEWGEAGPFAFACAKMIPRTKVEDWKE